MNEMRAMIIEELIATEESYGQYLTGLLTHHLFPLKALIMNNKNKIPISQEQVESLVTDVTTIHKLHVSFLKAISEESAIDAFALHLPFFNIYTQYVSNYDSVLSVYSKLRKNKRYLRLVKEVKTSKFEVDMSQNLPCYLIMPIQRVR